MAGVKGKSGGARPNSGGARPNSGGVRPGAGRKPKSAAKPPMGESSPQAPADVESMEASLALMDGSKREPLEFLELVMNDPMAPLKDRIRAAVAAAQYRHMKKHDGGKRDEQADAAKKAGEGRYKPAAPPRLVASR